METHASVILRNGLWQPNDMWRLYVKKTRHVSRRRIYQLAAPCEIILHLAAKAHAPNWRMSSEVAAIAVRRGRIAEINSYAHMMMIAYRHAPANGEAMPQSSSNGAAAGL